jgi:hypothetical protein
MGDQRVDVRFIKCALKMGCKDVDWFHQVQWRDLTKAVIKLWVI